MLIKEMKNMGPKMQLWLHEIGIKDSEQLAKFDPFDVYARLKQKFPQISLNALYALIGAIENRDWQEVKRQDRSEILLRLDDMGIAPKKTK